jgi:hypothetical protein
VSRVVLFHTARRVLTNPPLPPSAGAEVDIYQFPEILSAEILAKMHAAVRFLRLSMLTLSGSSRPSPSFL